MSTKTELDVIDRRILRLLAQDGRASYQAVADEVGLSRPAIMERVKRLEEGGYIRGYRAQLDRAKVGLPVTALVAVRYGSSDYVGDEPRMREMEKHPGVLECHHVAGEDCYVLKVVASDLEGVQEILRDLRGPNAQMNTRTTIVLSTLFEKPGFIPTEPD
jgi:Lrp/AsnC family leucine-responsive transcriptional regulator